MPAQDTKITALAAIGANPINVATFPIPMVDLLDNSMAASGTTKKVTVNQILGAGGTATLASATITGDLTVDTSTLKVDSSNDRVGIGTATPAAKLIVRDGSNRNLLVSSDASQLGSAGVAIGSFTDNAAGYAPLSIIAGTSMGFGINGSTAMTLNAAGLGVGVASPTNKLNLATSSGSCIAGMTNGTNSCRYAIDSTGPYIYSLTSGAQSLRVIAPTGLTVFTIDETGNCGIGVAPAGTGGCLQLKSGITFPATQVASSDANTLDDYEEGTWTGTLKGSVSDPTIPVTATGAYTKVGRLVTVTIRYINVLTTGASGDVTITGLPFSGAENSAGSSVAFSMFTTSTTLACWNNATTIVFYVSGTFTPATHNAGTNRSVTVTITYYV